MLFLYLYIEMALPEGKKKREAFSYAVYGCLEHLSTVRATHYHSGRTRL